MNPENSSIFSNNISILKVLAITAIIYGHFWNIHLAPIPLMHHWWVTVAIGLLVFSITSGYFTADRYHNDYDRKSYWTKKFRRIGIPLTIINCLLLVLFLLQQKEDILSVQTIASWLGIHALWAWFGITHVGPYGAGLWFLTALIIFYILYPILEHINRNKVISYAFTTMTVVALLIFHSNTSLGYNLWLTISGFFTGVWMAKNKVVLSRHVTLTLLVSAMLTMIVLKFIFQVKVFNGLLMLIISFSLVQACRFVVLPSIIYKIFLPFSPWVLSMYIIHMYMFVSPSSSFFLNWILSFAIILCVSCFVDYSSKRITRLIQTKYYVLLQDNHAL